jgi:ubiquinone/menaquinone biosynthesis C-methylase UbiE
LKQCFKRIQLMMDLRHTLAAKKSFKQMANIYDQYRRPNDQVLEALSNIVAGMKENGKTLSLLDVGCGTGGYSIPLAKRHNLQLTGVDVSEEMLRQAESKYPEARWLLEDFEKASFGAGSFDIILMSYVIQHLTDLKGDLRKALRLLVRPNGRLIIVTDDHDQFRSSPLHRFIPKAMEIDLRRFPAVEELCGCLEGIGFEVTIHRVGREESISNEEEVKRLLERVRARYISTLTLLTDEELQKGLEEMEIRLNEELKQGAITRRRERTILLANPPR